MVMEFREYRMQDFDEVCELIRNELGYPVKITDLQDSIDQMQRDDHYRIFVATDGKSVVGFVGIAMGLAFEVPGSIMTIIALAVSQAYQGSGVGTALLQMAQEFGKTNHASVIFVNSGFPREAAHMFYEKQGFSKKGYIFMNEAPNDTAKHRYVARKAHDMQERMII
jgi:ribosomal protein S18 acetylase RimI-like enzyme